MITVNKQPSLEREQREIYWNQARHATRGFSFVFRNQVMYIQTTY